MRPKLDEVAPKSKEPFFEKPTFLYTLLASVLVLGAAYYLVVRLAIPGDDKRGQFGDAFGAINAIFTGLAFAAVAYGIILQRREIKQQQRELTDTREVFKQQSFESLTLISSVS